MRNKKQREIKIPKSLLKQQRIDIQRGLRVVKYIDYPFILENSPIELEEGYIVSDRETCDVFASFIFKNISDRPIKKLNIRLACYQNQNIPYENIDFTYSQEKLTFGIISKNGNDMKLRDANQRIYIEKNESFGACVFIPIPERYFSKLEVILVSVEYVNSDVEELDMIVAGNSKRYSELDDLSKLAYSRMNIYVAAEQKFPTTVIPQFGENVWLCCCGTKNIAENDRCEKCQREKAWLEQSVSTEALEKTRAELVADPTETHFHDKTRYRQNKYLENNADIQKKIHQYEKAMENIALEEKLKERKQNMLLPKVLLAVLGIYLLASILEFFFLGTGIVAGIVSIIQMIYQSITQTAANNVYILKFALRYLNIM